MSENIKHPIRVVREYYEYNTGRIEPMYGYDITERRYRDKIQYRNSRGKWVDAPVFNASRKRYEK